MHTTHGIQKVCTFSWYSRTLMKNAINVVQHCSARLWWPMIVTFCNVHLHQAKNLNVPHSTSHFLFYLCSFNTFFSMFACRTMSVQATWFVRLLIASTCTRMRHKRSCWSHCWRHVMSSRDSPAFQHSARGHCVAQPSRLPNSPSNSLRHLEIPSARKRPMSSSCWHR